MWRVEEALRRSRIVALLGARQTGKTTLAKQLAAQHQTTHFDLEDPTDQARLNLPKQALEDRTGLVVLDEFQLRPDLLPILRVLADRTPQTAQFLLLGSASPDLIREASETLAGRIEFVDVAGLELDDVGSDALDSLWVRGAFPLAFLADNDHDSLVWRSNLVRTFLERDLGRFGFGLGSGGGIVASPDSMRRLWQMIAHYHGGIWNASEFGRSLGVSAPTVGRHLDVLVGAFVVRRLEPWHENLGKRLVKQPKIYVRDSGLLHALLGLETLDDLRGHPKCGASWEGFVIEQILMKATGWQPWFWATHGGAELDLLLIRGNRRLGLECKYTETPRATRSMHVALRDLRLDEITVIYPGHHTFPLADKIIARPLPDAGERLAETQ